MLGLFRQRWTVAQCTEAFQNLSRKLFQRLQVAQPGVWKKGLFLVKTWAKDGMYDSAEFEEALTGYFGCDTMLLENHAEALSGTKIAITATTTGKTARSRIFTNYDGAGERDDRSGKLIQSPSMSAKVTQVID